MERLFVDDMHRGRGVGSPLLCDADGSPFPLLHLAHFTPSRQPSGSVARLGAKSHLGWPLGVRLATWVRLHSTWRHGGSRIRWRNLTASDGPVADPSSWRGSPTFGVIQIVRGVPIDAPKGQHHRTGLRNGAGQRVPVNGRLAGRADAGSAYGEDSATKHRGLVRLQLRQDRPGSKRVVGTL